MGENAGLNTDPLKGALSYTDLLMYTDVITVELSSFQITVVTTVTCSNLVHSDTGEKIEVQ